MRLNFFSKKAKTQDLPGFYDTYSFILKLQQLSQNLHTQLPVQKNESIQIAPNVGNNLLLPSNLDVETFPVSCKTDYKDYCCNQTVSYNGDNSALFERIWGGENWRRSCC